jgi:hypothetical protein
MKDNNTKVPPNNIEAEQGVLGSLILSNKEIGNVINILSVDDFYTNANQIIFKTILSLNEEGKVIDYITICNSLRDSGKLDSCGGMTYIATLGDNVSSSVLASHYAEIVKEKSLLRMLLFLGNEIVDRVHNNQVKSDKLIAQIEEKIVNVVNRNRPKEAKKTVLQEVEEYVHSKCSKCEIYNNLQLHLLSIYNDLDFRTKEEKSACRMAVKKLCEKGVLEPLGGKSGIYKIINAETSEINYMTADDEPYDWNCPLKTHEFVKIYPGSVILIAGESNTGKTSYCLNVAQHYKEDRPVNYFSSEMEDIELKARLKQFNVPLESWKQVRFIQRVSNFAEVVRPNELNIIDYLEIYKDFYEVAGLIRAIKDKISKGIAIIAIQKNSSKEFGMGGESTKNLSRLYITMSPGKAKIVKGKMWATLINPDGLTVEYKLVGGAHFQVKNSWKKEEKTPF